MFKFLKITGVDIKAEEVKVLLQKRNKYPLLETSVSLKHKPTLNTHSCRECPFVIQKRGKDGFYPSCVGVCYDLENNNLMQGVIEKWFHYHHIPVLNPVSTRKIRRDEIQNLKSIS